MTNKAKDHFPFTAVFFCVPRDSFIKPMTDYKTAPKTSAGKKAAMLHHHHHHYQYYVDPCFLSTDPEIHDFE